MGRIRSRASAVLLKRRRADPSFLGPRRWLGLYLATAGDPRVHPYDGRLRSSRQRAARCRRTARTGKRAGTGSSPRALLAVRAGDHRPGRAGRELRTGAAYMKGPRCPRRGPDRVPGGRKENAVPLARFVPSILSARTCHSEFQAPDVALRAHGTGRSWCRCAPAQSRARTPVGTDGLAARSGGTPAPSAGGHSAAEIPLSRTT